MFRCIKWASIFFIAAGFLDFAKPSFADQAAYLNKEEAQIALELLSGQKHLRIYCAPCKFDDFKSIPVKKLEARRTKDEKYWKILLNGDGLDLAYTYFFHEGAWRNVALTMGMKNISDVPETISDNLAEELKVLRFVPPAQTIIEKCSLKQEEVNPDNHTFLYSDAAYAVAMCLEEEIIKHMEILLTTPLKEIKGMMKKLRTDYIQLQEALTFEVEVCGISCGSFVNAVPNNRLVELYEMMIVDVLSQRRYYMRL